MTELNHQRDYSILLLRLNELLAADHDDHEADAIRDQMDHPWRRMTEEERQRVRWLSVDLDRLENGGEPQASHSATDGQHFRQELRLHWNDAAPEKNDRVLELLRTPQAAALRPGEREFLRGRSWASAGFPEVGMRFFAVAEKSMLSDELDDSQPMDARSPQTQKMEVVGRLASGISHDINNLLTVINGFADIALEHLSVDHPAREMVTEVRRCGGRATDLLRHILLLSRQQVVEPRVFELNTVVSNLTRLLGRLIGADVELRTELAPDLRRLRADPGQVEQVMLNLAVNARDAMPNGGTLTIETMNATPSDSARAGVEPRPGGHVVLRVSDTGSGMTAEVRNRIFEPFFTTKAIGQGTGLGLATVMTLVQQAGGRVAVESVVGTGTTFEVYWPATTEVIHVEKDDRAQPVPVDRRGKETVVLAEDEGGVRTLARMVLERAGYVVLEAADGVAALEIIERHHGQVDALVTDMMMPRLGGKELAERLSGLRPGLKVLYMSGYTQDEVFGEGVDEGTMAFLAKPFTPVELAAKVHAVLSTPA